VLVCPRLLHWDKFTSGVRRRDLLKCVQVQRHHMNAHPIALVAVLTELPWRLFSMRVDTLRILSLRQWTYEKWLSKRASFSIEPSIV
jgi:hypothetical protein